MLHAGTPVWPGEPAFALERNATIGENCPVNVGAIHTPRHAGTHADSPFHYDAAGLTSAETDLAPYLGPCVILDARLAKERIEEADVDWAAVAGAERVLFRTYERFPHDHWDSRFAALAPESRRYAHSRRFGAR